MGTSFLPMTVKEARQRGWDSLDVILVTGDAYVDHPSYGAAVIGRVVEAAGWRVGIIAQPDWRNADSFKRLGRPRLFFGITGGNMDSMVANYTAHKRPRGNDDYSPGGMAGLRPDHAVIVYANRVREAFKEVPIVLGGIEASLRRLAHYDWWSNSVRRSILLDSRADILVYGMGETQVLEIARRISSGETLDGIRGTAVIASAGKGTVEIPSYEEVRADPDKFNYAFRLVSENRDPFTGKAIAQKHANRHVIQYPPALPIETEKLDAVYELPYARAWHPSYDRDGGVPGFETVRFSIISHRGCPGECSFCGLSLHQGRIVQSRSAGSIIKEAAALTERKDFRGTITDVGGPTANLYGAACTKWQGEGACSKRYCLTPTPCENLDPGYRKSAPLYRRILDLPRVKHLFIESGFRHDLLLGGRARSYLEAVCRDHVSGRMKVAPEHSANHVLDLMNKPPFTVYERFSSLYRSVCEKIKKDQYLVSYFISAHPGTTLEDAMSLALKLKEMGIHPEQVQDFMPLPMTRSGCSYYTERDPFTGKKVYVAKNFRERKMHRALLQHKDPGNTALVKEALKLLGKEHLLSRLLPGKKMTKKS